MRGLDQLIDQDDPGWPVVLDWISAAKNQLQVLPASDPQRLQALLAAQVTTRSAIGAIIYESGGLLVDGGWLRILGSGHARLPRTLPGWTASATRRQPGEWPFFLIADDVLGGFFALDGGLLGEPNSVFYLPPDTMEWEDLGLGYSDFVGGFCLNGDLDDFYNPYRWLGWRDEIASLDGDKCLSIVPPLWISSEPEHEDDPVAARSRRPIDITEAFNIAMELREQFEGVPNGSISQFRI